MPCRPLALRAAGCSLGAVPAGPVTAAVFRKRWQSAVPAVRVLALTTPAILLAYLLWFTLLAEGQERWLCVGAVAGAATSVAASAVLLAVSPDAAAAAWGTGAGAVVLLLVLTARFVLTRADRHDGARDDRSG